MSFTSRLNQKIFLVNNFISTLSLNFLEALKIISRDLVAGKIYGDNFIENLRKIIWGSLLIAILTVSASAFIYSIHIAPEFLRRGLSEYLGGLVAIALIREGVPVIASLAIVAHYSTGMTAQIGSMRISEQLDAMKILKVFPNAYMLVPMLLAGVIGFPIVAVICVFVGLVVNFISSHLLIDINYQLYFSSIVTAVTTKDIVLCFAKTSVFGFVVALISYVCGITTKGGSKGVGNATRLSVVLNFILVVVLDYIITALWM